MQSPAPSTTKSSNIIDPGDSLREKAKACRSAEDVLALAKEEGYELSDEQLQAISGGDWDCWTVCTGQCGKDCLYYDIP